MDNILKENMLKEILTDEQYDILLDLNIFNKIVLRNIVLKKTFVELRKSFRPEHCIDILQNKHVNYLDYDSIKKIVYSTKIPGDL